MPTGHYSKKGGDINYWKILL